MVSSLSLNKVKDIFYKGIFSLCGLIAGSMILVIVGFILFRGVSVFLPSYGMDRIGLFDFLTGLTWQSDQGQYGVLFIVINTVMTSFFADFCIDCAVCC